MPSVDWLARDQLGLSADTAALITQRIQSTAEACSSATRTCGWAAVTADDPKKWLPEFRDQLRRWCAGAERVTSPWDIPNLSPSWSFHRDPLTSINAAENIESNEYACIILDALSYLREAKEHGLVLSAQEKKVLYAWSKRALAAYFTHSGYPNWDTGLFLERWHLGRYWAWSLGGLFAIMLTTSRATRPTLRPPSGCSIARSRPTRAGRRCAARPCRRRRPIRSRAS